MRNLVAVAKHATVGGSGSACAPRGSRRRSAASTEPRVELSRGQNPADRHRAAVRPFGVHVADHHHGTVARGHKFAYPVEPF